MIRACFFIICCALVSGTYAQKIVRKSLTLPQTSFYQIDTQNCFDLELNTSKSDELIVEAIIDGEYSKDLIIMVAEVGSSVLINAGFRPDFVNPNDKLSAHKVVSIALRIMLPQLKNVQISGTRCNVTVAGLFGALSIALDDGRCTLNEVSQNVLVRTQSGDITVNSANVAAIAKTKYGKITGQDIAKGDSTFRLTSVSGDIHLHKTNY